MGLGKGGDVQGKTSHNGTTGGPDSESYHQRLIRIPAEDCGFHPLSFEEAGRCCRCLHLILIYACIFPFKKVHIKIIFVIFALEIRIDVITISHCLLNSHPPCNIKTQINVIFRQELCTTSSIPHMLIITHEHRQN